jgi:prenylcysteine alpha-carboxyl methylesterase
VETLKANGAEAKVKLCEGKSHTDLFLQDPMRGGRDAVLEEICSIIHKTPNGGDYGNDVVKLQPRMVPEIFLKLAHKISPF